MTSPPGFRVILQGLPGSGKSTALNTLAKDCGLETFIVFLEKGMHVLEPDPKIHWAYIPTMVQSWESMLKNAKKIQRYSRKELLEMLPDTRSFPQFFDLINLLNNFTDHEGKEYGDVCEWGTDKALVVDGLTGLSKIAMSLGIGDKPVRHKSDWGLAMAYLETFIDKITESLNCHLVLIAHVEKEEIISPDAGLRPNMVSTLGQKLAPLIPNNFPDVILAHRRQKEFLWSTLNGNFVLKHFHLPLQNDLKPSFLPLYEDWKKRNGV